MAIFLNYLTFFNSELKKIIFIKIVNHVQQLPQLNANNHARNRADLSRVNFEKKKIKRLQHDLNMPVNRPEPPKLLKQRPTIANVVDQLSSSSSSSYRATYVTSTSTSTSVNSTSHLPAPPPLYKAPNAHLTNHHHHHVNTSANSSRLASASGMNNQLMKSMPKLQPIPQLNNPAPNPNPTQTTAAKDYLNSLPKLMPKLKPHNNIPQITAVCANGPAVIPIQQQPGPPPPPPQLILTAPVANKLPAGAIIVQPQSSPTTYLKISPKPPVPTVVVASSKSAVVEQNTAAASSSENLSLKCKFCLQIFKGQSEFFQHVIVSHPKMLKKKLNRDTAASHNSATTSTNGSLKPASTTTTTAANTMNP